MKLLVVISFTTLPVAWSFLARGGPLGVQRLPQHQHRPVSVLVQTINSSSTSDGTQHKEAWTGTVVPGSGQIRGCSLQQVAGSITEWIVTIDGVEADLGKFSEAIYKKMLRDAKQQRFQGFRPGTVPPHLLPTYKAFAMDECARETVLEALQQNNIRPFENCRSQLELVQFSIPPLAKQSSSKGNKRKKGNLVVSVADQDAASPEEMSPSWRGFETMKEALDAGWTPGQSFSFVAKKVTGQQLKDDKDADPIARPF